MAMLIGFATPILAVLLAYTVAVRLRRSYFEAQDVFLMI